MRADAEFLPLTGSPVRLDDLAGASARSANALRATAEDLLRLDRALAGQRSTAVDAARDVVADLRAGVALSDEVLRAVAAALADHADALTREQQQAAAAISRRDAALARLAQAEADEVAAWQRAAGTAWPDDTTRLVWDARARATEARGDVAAAETDWRAAREAKESGSRTTAARIGALEHVRAVRLATARGVEVGAFLASWQRGQRLAASFERVTTTARPGAPDPTLLAGVRGLGDDPVAWRAFWEHTEARDVLTALSGAPPGSSAVDALRTGVEIVAAGSTAAEQEAFGRRLVEGLGSGPHTAGAEAVLLAGMLGGALPVGVHAGAADALAERRSLPGLALADVTTLAAPVAQVVARGLAADPERALEHLAGDDPLQAAERAQFWFGDAPTLGWPDGGAAISAMLASAVATGNAPGASTEQRNQAASAISAATPQLASGTGLLAAQGGLPPQVERNIVRAYEPYIPSFGDTVSPDGERTGLAAEPGYVEPDLDPRSLCTVIDATSRTAHGTAAWFGAQDRYLADVEDLVGVATEDSGARTATIVDATRSALVIAGATDADVLQAADSRQSYTRAIASGAGIGIGVATLGTSAPVSAAGLAASTSIPLFADVAGADGVETARAELDASGDELGRQYLDRLVEPAEDADRAAGMDGVVGRLPTLGTHQEGLTAVYLDAADINGVLDPKAPERGTS